MVNVMLGDRQGDIHSDEFAGDFSKLCIQFEDSPNEEQIHNSRLRKRYCRRWDESCRSFAA